MPKNKNHTTITLTADQLRNELGACLQGIEDVAELLPAKLSTDPLKNLELAAGLVERAAGFRVDWLSEILTVEAEWPDDEYYKYTGANGSMIYIEPTRDVTADEFILAQWIAMIADKIATDAGR